MLAADPEARWLVYCSAESDTNGDGQLAVSIAPDGSLSGDLLSARLALGGQAPLDIEAYFDSDSTGRYLLVQAEGRVLLFDSVTRSATDMTELAADSRLAAHERPGHRAFAFAPHGPELAYLRRLDGKLDVVLRNLESGAETAIDPGVLEIYRLDFDALGKHLVLEVVASDSNKNGRFDWPYPLAKQPRPACAGPFRRFGARYRTGDATVAHVISLADRSVRPIPDLLFILDDGPVIRRASGELALEVPRSIPAVLASAQCGGRVLFADASKNLLVVGCPGKKSPGRAEVELVARGYLKRLGVFVQPTDFDARPVASQRLVPLYPGSETWLLDLERREPHPLTPGDLVIHTHATRALIRRKEGLVIYDVTTRAEQALNVTLPALPHVLTQGAFAVVTPAVVDLANGELAGLVRERPLALARDGRVLVSEGNGPSAERLARGPLVWKAPDPPSATAD